MELHKTKTFSPTNIRAALLALAGLARSHGRADWADHFIAHLPPSPMPKMGEIFIAAVSGLPPLPPKGERGYYPENYVEFKFKQGVSWTLTIHGDKHLSVEHSCPSPHDEGHLTLEVWGGVAEDPQEGWEYIFHPTLPERVCMEDLTGFDFLIAPGQWEGYIFSGCTFDTYRPPRALVDGGAEFIECRGPDGPWGEW